MQIYERIFERLGLLHMNQAELSRRTGIATSTISDWRKKKINPQSDKLVAICKALDMSLVDLLCDETDKMNNLKMYQMILKKELTTITIVLVAIVIMINNVGISQLFLMKTEITSF